MIMKNSKNSKASLESPEITSSYNLFLYGMPQSIQTNTERLGYVFRSSTVGMSLRLRVTGVEV